MSKTRETGVKKGDRIRPCVILPPSKPERFPKACASGCPFGVRHVRRSSPKLRPDPIFLPESFRIPLRLRADTVSLGSINRQIFIFFDKCCADDPKEEGAAFGFLCNLSIASCPGTVKLFSASGAESPHVSQRTSPLAMSYTAPSTSSVSPPSSGCSAKAARIAAVPWRTFSSQARRGSRSSPMASRMSSVM